MADGSKRKRRRKNNAGDDPNDRTIHKNKYGFIEFENPAYYSRSSSHEEEFLLRKPTLIERREMVINYIIRRDGKPINIPKLASRLAVSDRTIQLLLRKLQEDKLIVIIPNYSESGQRKENSYRYIGEPVKYYGSGLQIGMITDERNRAGFRDYDWGDFKFSDFGRWNCQDDLEDLKYEHREKKRKYLQRVGVEQSAFGATKIKYFVLKYTHGFRKRKQNSKLKTEFSEYEIHAARCEGSCVLDEAEATFTNDGRIKFELDFDKPTWYFHLCSDFFIRAELKGDISNPEVHLYDDVEDEEAAEPFLIITYWGENYITLYATEADEYTGEYIHLSGEFTSK